jgi:hypothetical protein
MRILSSLLLLLSSVVFGQTYTISTLAGGGLPVNIAGVTALLGQATGVAADTAGNIFIASSSLHIVVRLDAATGILTLVAGNGSAAFPAASRWIPAAACISLTPMEPAFAR